MTELERDAYIAELEAAVQNAAARIIELKTLLSEALAAITIQRSVLQQQHQLISGDITADVDAGELIPSNQPGGTA